MNTEFKYSQELIQAIKTLYPDYDKLLQLAENGSFFLKEYLQGSYLHGIPNEKVLTAITLEEIQAEARLNILKHRLYEKCCKEIQVFRENEMNDQN